MTGNRHEVQSLRTEPVPFAFGPVGITRLDLVCNPEMGATAQALARRWCDERAVPSMAAERIVALVLAAVGHGLRFAPRALSIDVRWHDPDRVRVDLRWRDSSRVAVSKVDNTDLDSTAAVFDALSEEWGFGGTGSGTTQWFVVDTRC